ncbi:hypothetical protein DYB37_000884 [Aphanomyces astaci]|uniref:Uncharacterized protein n=1 Tax=Aphanomyces astaci TaxID=112090 RepID=A0A3R6XBK7_APHAT|nr:hypothetical protein DYB35_000604 [Aphanomyces astaci]RHZ04894.1 hypothetical protein DYB37_000884 [Aphanomyces astaci]
MTNAGELEQGSKLRRPLGDLDDAGSTPRKTKRLMVVHSNATHATPLKHQSGTATTVSHDIHPRTSLALSTGPAITALTLSSAATIQHTAEITAPSLDPIAPIRVVNDGKKRIQGCIVSCFYLHLDPEAKLPAGVRSRLQKHQLAHFAFGGGKLKSLKLGRDMFGSAVETLNTRRLGRNHCKLTHERGTLYVERCTLHSLLSWGCQVLHFLGQGNHEHVYLEDHLGLVHPLTYVDFFGMLEVTSTASKRTLKLVVLSYTPSRKLVDSRHSILGFGHRIVCGFVSAFMQKRASESGNFCMWTYVRKVTRTHSTTNTTKWPSLIVLIGCDPWLADEHTSAGFRAMLQTWLDATAHLKVVLTATTAVTSTHKLQHIAEDMYD